MFIIGHSQINRKSYADFVCDLPTVPDDEVVTDQVLAKYPLTNVTHFEHCAVLVGTTKPGVNGKDAHVRVTDDL